VSGDLAARLHKLRDAYAADVIDADMFEAGLAKLRREYGADAVDQLLAAAKPAASPASRSAAVTGQVGHLFLGDIQGHVFINGRRGKEPAQLLAGYLQRIAQHCAVLPLQGVREQRAATDTFRLSLDAVYTQLATTQDVEREVLRGAELAGEAAHEFLAAHTGDKVLPALLRTEVRIRERPHPAGGARAATRPRREAAGPPRTDEEFEDVVPIGRLDLDKLRELAGRAERLTFCGPQLVTEAIAAERRLVLLGEPGSGKSTALRFLALTIARAGLDAGVDLAERLEGWAGLESHGRLLPLFLPLLPFARRVADEARQPAGAAELWNYLRDRLDDGGRRDGLAEAVHHELEQGHVLLMLDGLDEVAGEASRRQVVRAVQAFADEYPQCRIVVSCRVRAYLGEQNQAWRLAGWPAATLADWTPAQMRHFVGAWYHAAADATGMSEAKRTEREASLRRAITVREDLRRLGVRPLLMTIMALVHFNDQGQLPQERVALYSRCVDLLLGQWELAREDGTDYGALMDFIELPDTDVKVLRPLLEQAAFQAHRASKKDSPGSLGAATLRDMVASFLEARGHANPYRGARRFLEYTDVRAGLLQASDAGEAYVFPHQTFQEYLAGRALVSGVGVVERIWDLRDDDRWRVPILLGVGDHVTDGKLEMPLTLLMRLVHEEGCDPAQAGRDLFLAAEIAEDVSWASLEERGGVLFRRLRADLAAALAGIVTGRTLPAAERVWAGVIVGELDDPRPGVCDLPPPFVPFPGGGFVIGISEAEYRAIIAAERKNNLAAENWYKDARNSQTVAVAAFELARYPLTNAQYKLFMDAGGYRHDAPWWDEAARAWLRLEEATEPTYWRDARFGIARPNHPVVGISWYEATAFCKWLTQHLNDGYVYLLPSEAEWEYAARGPARRPYPWGDDLPDGERANFNQTHGGTSAVGCFAAGATPEGLLDLAGNVWEWTRSEYRSYPYDPNDGREAGGDPARKTFTIRGASWATLPFNLRAADRYHFDPDGRSNDVGVRLARHLA